MGTNRAIHFITDGSRHITAGNVKSVACSFPSGVNHGCCLVTIIDPARPTIAPGCNVGGKDYEATPEKPTVRDGAWGVGHQGNNKHGGVGFCFNRFDKTSESVI